VPTLAQHEINGNSAEKRSPHEREIHRKNGYSSGNYQLRDEESAEVWDSAGNYQFIDEESSPGRGLSRKSLSLLR
jgi:hypothetical protein